jgi:hypothetical protein
MHILPSVLLVVESLLVSGASKMVLSPLAVEMEVRGTGVPGVEVAPVEAHENLGRLLPNSMGAAVVVEVDVVVVVVVLDVVVVVELS